MERKYKSICEGLDFGDNKKALQECDKLLRRFEIKKQDKIDVKFIRALKCLGLCRVGKRSDAVDILTSLLAEKPSDVEVLQVLQTVCKELRLYETLASMFENAAKINPSEEILSNLFMACVINNDYKRQQQVALKLHQACPDKNNYYFWSVASIVMQAISEPKLAKSIYLPLAEKLCYKFIQENRITAETEVILYLDILKRQDHYDEAIKFLLESPLVRAMDEIDYRQTRLAEFYYLKQSWPDCFDSYQRLLLNHPDQWAFWERLVDCALQICSEGDSSKITAVLASVSDAQTTKNGYHPRAPLLVPLYLIMMAQQRYISADQLNTLSAKESFRAYLKLYSNRPCACDDLQPYLKLLEAEEVREMCAEVVHSHVFFKESISNGKSAETTDDSDAKKPSRMFDELDQIVTTEALMLYRDSHSKDTPVGAFVERVERLKQVYTKYDAICLSNGGSALNEGEYRPGDRIAILTASSMLELFRRTGNVSYLYEAGSMLMDLSNNNYHKQLLLLLLFNFLGAGLHAFYVFMKLDIKHIQFETLGYLSLTTLSQSGSFTHYSAVLDGCLRQTAMSGVEFSHAVPLAYHYGTFTKIPEMIELQQRLRSSVEYFQYTLEKMIFDLTMSSPECVPSVAAEVVENLFRDRIPWNELVLTRDYNPLATCFLNVPSKEDCEQFLALQKAILRLSIAEAKLVSSCVSRLNMDEVTTIGSELISLANDLKAENEKMAASATETWPVVPYLHCWPMNDLAVLPARCVLLTSVARLSARIISALANFETSEQDPFDSPMMAEIDLIHDIETQLKDLVSTLKADESSFENQSETFRRLYGVTRTLCEVSVCLIVPVERMRFVKGQQAKLAKKKKDLSVNSNFYDVHNDLAKSFQDSVETCNQFCGNLREKLNPIAVESANTFRGRVFESYCGQLQQLSDRLTRLSYFNLTVK